MFYQFLYPCPYFSFLQVIGGDLQERLIPVPYSKSTTDQAVREIQYLLYCCSKSIYFLFYIIFLWHTNLCIIQCIFLYGCAKTICYASFTANFSYIFSATKIKTNLFRNFIECFITR